MTRPVAASLCARADCPVDRAAAAACTREHVAPRPVADVRVKALQRFALSITALTLIGHLLAGFEQAPIVPIVAVGASYGTALLLEWLDAWSRLRPPEFAGGVKQFITFLLPPHITGLACALLLFGNSSVWPYVMAAVVANSSKYLFRISVKGRLRHFLNPTNTGLVVVLLAFPWVGIAPPYHFTNNLTGAMDWLLPLGILVLGTALNAKLTGKMPLIIGWVGGFVAQAAVRAAFFDHSFIAALMPMTGLAFILFTNYMITDPGTTPVKRRNQIIFGAATAAIYGLLVVSGVVFGLFFALVITCVLRGAVLVLTPHAPTVADLRARLGSSRHDPKTPPAPARSSHDEPSSTPVASRDAAGSPLVKPVVVPSTATVSPPPVDSVQRVNGHSHGRGELARSIDGGLL